MRVKPGDRLLEDLLGTGGFVDTRGVDQAVSDHSAEDPGQRDAGEHEAERAPSRQIGVFGRSRRRHESERTVASPRETERVSGPLSVREWTVAGGLLETPEGVLLVRNQRRGGIEDWSTPGGVIDADDADLIAGLTREVEEETGLVVREWSGPLYEVHAFAPDMGWRMRCEVHLAVSFTGLVRVDDPDGIVVEAAFVPPADCADRLSTCAPWVREPLGAWLTDRWDPDSGVGFHYEVHGATRDDMRVVRSHDTRSAR